MTTITLEVPDELAIRLAPLHDQLPKLLSIAADLFAIETLSSTTADSEAIHPTLKETIDFLISGPTLEQIIGFKISSVAQARLEELLDTKRESSLTEDETIEFDLYGQINHFLILLKAQARTLLPST